MVCEKRGVTKSSATSSTFPCGGSTGPEGNPAAAPEMGCASDVRPPRVTHAEGAAGTPPGNSPWAAEPAWLCGGRARRPSLVLRPSGTASPRASHSRFGAAAGTALSRRNAAPLVSGGRPGPTSAPPRGPDAWTGRRSAPPCPSRARAPASAASLGENVVRAPQGEACRSGAVHKK